MSPLSGLPLLRSAKSKRISSYDRSGGNDDFVVIGAGERLDVARIDGPGTITHLWFTFMSPDPLAGRNLVLRMYWDGQEHPSVESPIGDFFGQGWGEHYVLNSMPLVAAPKEGRALTCYFPMPFATSARIEVENESAHEIERLYFCVDYESGEIPESSGRFHAQYRQALMDPGDGTENEWETLGPTAKHASADGNYVFCECEGNGHLVGLNLYVGNPGPIWYGEGDDMFLVDDEPWPGSAHGTGIEDYFNMAWCPAEPFQHPYFGFGRLPTSGLGWLGRTHLYRFHLEDPIRFSKSLNASIEHGHANCLTLEMASVAYWYQSLPSKPFEPIAPAADRIPRPEIGVVDVHRWRDAWRQTKGGGPLWGNEPPDPRYRT